MFTFVRRHRVGMSLSLSVLISFFSGACNVYYHKAVNPNTSVNMVRFFVLDESAPASFAWRVDADILTKSGLEGKISRLTDEEAKRVAKGYPQYVGETKSLQVILLYLKTNYAKTLVDSTQIHLSFSQVTHSEAYEYSPKGSHTGPFLIGFFVAPVAFTIIAAIACSCPYIYTDNPDGAVFEGDVFPGATHPQLERHDWLPLSNPKDNGGLYRLRMVNEDPEIQNINFLELIAVDHAPGLMVLYDKYGRLHTLAQPESPILATNLEGQDVQTAIEKEDQNAFRGTPNTTNIRAEDGLILQFKRPPGARSAKLVIRANTAPWLAYSHEQLQRDLGKYGPKVRQKFLKKDSADLQQWALRQNIPLSVWLETAPGHWERSDFFHLTGPKAPRRDVLHLDLSNIKGEVLRLKLATGFQFWEIDYVALDFSPEAPVHTQVLPLAAATDQNGRDLTALLRNNDRQYYIQTKKGDEATLRFPAPPKAANAGRTLLLHAKGHYQIQREPVAGSPSRRYLRQFARADAFPQYARQQWQALAGRDTIWMAAQNR